MKVVVSFLAGLIIGAVLLYFTIMNQMPKQMLNIDDSNYGFEQTVEEIQKKAEAAGWKVPKVYDLQKSLQSDGYEDMTKLKVLSLCQPEHAYNILKDDMNKKVSGMMPCRIAVYENSEGEVKISHMNVGLMSGMFGGVIEEVMGKVSEEQHDFMSGIIKK